MSDITGGDGIEFYIMNNKVSYIISITTNLSVSSITSQPSLMWSRDTSAASISQVVSHIICPPAYVDSPQTFHKGLSWVNIDAYTQPVRHPRFVIRSR